MRDKLNGLVNKYRTLRGQRDAGRISDEEYKRQLEGSAVADDRQEGCWWNISPESGLWIFFDGREWVQQAPEGFDPMVSTGPVPTVQRPLEGPPARGGGSLAWLWIVLAVVVIAAVGTGVTLLVVLNSGGGGAGADAEDRIEAAIEDFYKAADDADYDDLSPLITSDVADDMEDAENDDELEDLLRPYEGLDVDDIDDIEIDGDEATAMAILERNGQRIEQEIELELDGGKWKIADLGKLETSERRDNDQPRREERSGSTETDVRNFLDSFMQAFKRYDIDAMKTMVAASAHDEMDFEEMEQARSDPEQYQALLEYMQQLTWEIYDLNIDASSDRASATIRINLAPNPQRVDMERRGGLWLIISIVEIEQ